jgi:hypothetical protein
MRNAHARPGRPAPALILAVLGAVTIAVLVFVGQASAVPSWEHGTATTCTACHTDVMATAANATIACSTCHLDFTASLNGSTPADCGEGCHAPGGWTAMQLAAVKTNAAGTGCGSVAAGVSCHGGTAHVGSTLTTCVNCHGVTVSTTDPGQSAHHESAVTDVTVKALLTIKTNAGKIRLGKTVKVSGLAKSVQPGYAIKVVIQKKGRTWKTIATKAARWTQSSSSWTYTYKPTKKGSYRFKAAAPKVVGTNGNAVAIPAKVTAYKNLTVK